MNAMPYKLFIADLPKCVFFGEKVSNPDDRRRARTQIGDDPTGAPPYLPQFTGDNNGVKTFFDHPFIRRAGPNQPAPGITGGAAE